MQANKLHQRSVAKYSSG